MARSTIAAIQFNTGILSGLTSDALEQNENMAILSADGNLSPEFVALLTADPMWRGNTTDLENLFGNILTGSEGPFLSFTQMDRFIRLLVNTGTRAPGATHIRAAATLGVLYATALSAVNNQIAAVDLVGEALSVGGTLHPWTLTPNIALPASAGLTEQFTMGPVSINGASIIELSEWSIDFGWSPTADPQDQGLAYPVYKALMEYGPSVRVRSMDMSLLQTFNEPVAVAVSDVVLYLRQIQEGLVRWPAANVPPKHIRFTIDDGTILAIQAESGQGDQSGVELVITPTDDKVNDVIAIATGVDIV